MTNDQVKHHDLAPYVLLGAALAAGPVGWLGIGAYSSFKTAQYVGSGIGNLTRKAKRTASGLIEARRQEKLAEIRMQEAERLRQLRAEEQRRKEEYARLHPPPTIEQLLDQVQFDYKRGMAHAATIADDVLRETVAEKVTETYRNAIQGLMR